MAFDPTTVSPQDGYNYFEFNITSANTTINLANDRGGDTTTWDGTTDWGDGTSNTSTSHKYTSTGVYVVKTKYKMNSDETTRLSLSSCYGINYNMTDLSNMFMNCKKLSDTSYTFEACNSSDDGAMLVIDPNDGNYWLEFESGGIFSKDYKRVSYDFLEGAFSIGSYVKIASTEKKLDVSNWDVSKVTNMSNMFNEARNIIRLDTSKWNISKVTNMDAMFSFNVNLESLGDVSNWNTSNLESAVGMFIHCHHLNELNVTNWNVDKLYNATEMFRCCQSLPTLDVSKWNLAKSANRTLTADGMFRYCAILPYMDVSKFNVEGASMPRMFQDCEAMETVVINDWVLNNTNVTDIFRCDDVTILKNVTYLTTSVTYANMIIDELPNRNGYEIGTFKTSTDIMSSVNTSTLQTKNWNVEEAQEVFDGTNCNIFEFTITNSNTTIQLNNDRYGDTTTWNELTNWGDGTIDKQSTHTYASAGTYIVTTKWGVPIVNSSTYNNDNQDTADLLTNCLDINPNMTNLVRFFNKCVNLVKVDSTDWNTSKVIDMSYMFFGCTSLIKLDILNWNIANTTVMAYMFGGCTSLKKIDMSTWDVKKVNNMNGMFSDCSGLVVLDLSNFYTVGLTNTSEMFKGCSNLTILDLSNINTESCTSVNNMFNGCSKLQYLGLMYCSSDTIDDVSALLPTSTNNGTIYVKDNTITLPTLTNGWRIWKQEYETINVNLPQGLKAIGDTRDRFYWDRTKSKYCIEQKINIPAGYNQVINESLILGTPVVIDTTIVDKIPMNTYTPYMAVFIDDRDGVPPLNIKVDFDIK